MCYTKNNLEPVEFQVYIDKYKTLNNQYNYATTIEIINCLTKHFYTVSTISNKNLNARKLLLFLSIWFTGLNLDYLLHFKKYNLQILFQLAPEKEKKKFLDYGNYPGFTYLITHVIYGEKKNSLKYTNKSEVFSISFRDSLTNNITEDEKQDLFDKLNNLDIFTEEYFNKKDGRDYIFSLLHTTQQPIRKTNAIKEMNELLTLLKEKKILCDYMQLDNLFTIT